MLPKMEKNHCKDLKLKIAVANYFEPLGKHSTHIYIGLPRKKWQLLSQLGIIMSLLSNFIVFLVLASHLT